MINYAVSIFISAFLLFQIQPIISKTLLPWFGGTPAVWSSAMLFFQVALTGGYAYSNWLVRIKPKKQTLIHLTLIGISVCLVIYLWIIWPSPVTPAISWRPDTRVDPVLYIFFLLTISVGLPFFVLSTNSPLMQAWFNRTNPGRSPYWLYALSNVGSLLGLIAYPVLVEPMLTLQWQGWVWSGGYVIFVLIAGGNAIFGLRGLDQAPILEIGLISSESQKLKIGVQTLWILLSACASLLVLAVTSQITQEVAVIPFLWVLPLIIYLLSFVFAFSDQRLYQRGLFTTLLFISTTAWIYILINPLTNYILQIVIYSILLFSAAMICHGELYALRPNAELLTRFYLLVSIGGAIGGIFVNLVAPIIFQGYWELYLGFAFVWILLAFVSYQRTGTRKGFLFNVLIGTIATAVTLLMVFFIQNISSGNLYIHRNFYGVVRVKQMEFEKGQVDTRVLVHGSTIHGFQFIDPTLKDTATSYFSRNSGVGLAIINNPHYGTGMRVGILGLGAGTLAAYGQSGDRYRFYEINQEMVDLANGKAGYFSFLQDSQAEIEVVVGDARLSLENELKEGMQKNFDILILDTFSSDAIPVHLVTREAFEIYLKCLASDGLIAANITNDRLDLRPVLWQLAQYYKLDMAVLRNSPNGDSPGAFQSIWVLLTRNSKLLEAPALTERVDRMDGFSTYIRLWTDDYSNLIQILK